MGVRHNQNSVDTKRSFLLICLFVVSACNGSGTSSPTELQAQSLVSTPTENLPQSQPEAELAFPFNGVVTLDDYDWFGTSTYLGVVDITLSPLSKKRLVDGSLGRRHQSGDLVYRQPCGSRVHRIMRMDATGRSNQLTPCSSEVPNSGSSATDFEFSTLSYDSSKIAVEVKYFLNSNFQFGVAVFDTTSRALLATWDGAFAPMWLRNDRLLLSSSEGFYLLDENLDNPVRLPDGLTGRVNNPALHPSENTIAFEYNQQIWVMSADGSDAKELIFGAARLRYPAWSPDGNTIAYLATDDGDRYHKNLYFTHIPSQTSYALDLRPVLDSINVSNVPNGPLSWR